MSNNIEIIADFSCFAVWNALKLHINFMLKAGFTPVIYTSSKDNYKIVIQEYPNNKVLRYSNILVLFKLLNQHKESTFIWYPDIFAAWKVIFLKPFVHKQFVYWIQGTEPDESYMRHKSLLRKRVLEFFEYFSLILSDRFVFVSDTMSSFYSKKYKISFKRQTIIPCVSEFKIDKSVLRIPKSFVYIGGLSVWQRFDDILLMYSKIKKKIPDSIFHIITLDVEIATFKVNHFLEDNSDIKIYSIRDRNKIPSILSQFEYGFLIREDILVNNVSSPIKFAEYLSCGVNIITTEAIPHYAELIKKYRVGAVLDNSLDISDFDFIPDSNNAIRLSNNLFSELKMVEKYRVLLNE